MLKSAGLPLYRHLICAWLLAFQRLQDVQVPGQCGRSPRDRAKFGIDAFRYFLLREMHFGSDASFNERGLIRRINSDLANDLGNLFQPRAFHGRQVFPWQTGPCQKYRAEDQAVIDSVPGIAAQLYPAFQ